MLQKGLKFAANESMLFSATVSLGLSTIARPVAILSTPNTDMENKKYACAKSLSSSAVGYLLMAAASMPVARAVKKIDENPIEFLKKTTIDTLQNGCKSLQKSKKYQFATQLFKLGLGFLIAVPKSVMTCALIPPIMNFLFRKKNQNENNNSGKNVSFKGLYNKSTTKLSRGIGKLIDTKFVQNLSEKFYKTRYEEHMINSTDVLLTAAFIQQTNHSKKIDDSRKKALIYNAGISTGLSIAGGYTINSLLKTQSEKFIKKFREANKNLPELEKCVEGIKIAQPVLILGGIYYIIIPLLSTFFADRFDNQKH